MAEQLPQNCIFCRIANGLPPKPGQQLEDNLLYQNDTLVAFKDIRPVNEHHYLIVPKKHVGNPKSLTAEHLDLIKEMKNSALVVLEQQGVSAAEEDCLFGYHWPPFNTIQHLHLHAIGNRTSMSFMARMIYKSNSLWFVTHDWLAQRLEQMDQN